MQNSKPRYRVLLSFDLEEFDIPNEFGAALPIEEQLAVTQEGMNNLLPLLTQLNIPCTFFTTAFYAQENAAAMKSLAATHEIASHSFYHSRFTNEDLLASRQVLAAVTGQSIAGFRMPRLAPVDMALIRSAGYLYDASLHPTWLPGRYNHLGQPRTLFKNDGLWRMPSSVTPTLRFPLFWLAFKNLPLWFIQQCSLQVLKSDGYLSLYYHPWEYANLAGYHQLPLYIRRRSGEALLHKLRLYLQWLQTMASFS
ncbi:MAG TPA: polysaccharide deacetylase family protein, partial [Chitinophagaceae bacterium]|nr:polysaccharide deacetylase family protein [Chitinophagaceae bacterium]